MAESRPNGEPARHDGHPADEAKLQGSDGDKPSEFQRFEDLTRRLLGVPKRELDKKLKKR